MLLRPALVLAVVLLGGPAALAQLPSVAAVVNSASFGDSRLNNGKVPRGGIVTLLGQNMALPQVAVASSFPLPTDLQGTAVQILSGGQAFDCIVIVASAGQVSVIVPSAVPAGPAQLTVSFNGRSGPARAIEVVDRSIGAPSMRASVSSPSHPTY